MSLRVEQVESLRGFTDLIEQLMDAADAPLWFRGCRSGEHRLVPSLYRHPTTTDTAELIGYETRILTRFRQRSIPYLTRDPVNEWDFLFLMQHVGVPTRLLDWSENPYIALYFAVIGMDGAVRDNDASVWVINPTIWNRHALRLISFTGDVLSVGDEQLRGFAPLTSPTLMNSEPVALYGLHNSARIVAQRGVFTIFGQNAQGMEDQFDGSSYPGDALVKIVLPQSAVAALQKSMFSIGYAESVIFPDLDGLAREIKRQFGYR